LLDSGNENARRCFTTDSVILDPCFVRGYHATVGLCINDPRNRQAIMISVNNDRSVRNLDNPPQSLTAGDPWFIQMADGRNCGAQGGGSYVVAGMRAAYRCDDESVLFGSPIQQDGVWSIRAQSAASSELTLAVVAAVWF
jgi:hypothetical protein